MSANQGQIITILQQQIDHGFSIINDSLAAQSPQWRMYQFFRTTALDVLEQIYGSGHRAVMEFSIISVTPPPNSPFANDTDHQLAAFTVGVNIAVEKLAAAKFSVENFWNNTTSSSDSSAIFISYGGNPGKTLEKLKEFIRAVGAYPIDVIDEPSGGNSIEDKVDTYMAQSKGFIALINPADQLTDGTKQGRQNIAHEVGVASKSDNIQNRIILIVENGTKLPTNYSERVQIRYQKAKFESVFIQLARELKGMGLI